MNKKVILVDVDETVVPSVRHWVQWYKDLTGHDLFDDLKDENGKTKDLLASMHNHDEPMKFWKQPDLYQQMLPRKHSVEVLERLSKDFDIVFVSASMPEHTESKGFFLKKFFPFHSGFVSTADKEFVRGDVFIDDYKKYLDMVQDYQPDCLCIHIKTMLSNKGKYPLLGWLEIEDYIHHEVGPFVK